VKTIRVADLFCGAGGASVGLVRAAKGLSLKVDLLAVNHWPRAVETHTLNHPGVRHLCESVESIDPRKAIPGGRLQLLIAAPECTNHSRARGGRPVNDQSRATAWHVLKWAQELYIDSILLENVEEFREWGPLGANGKPLKTGKGQTYLAFLDALRSLGYRVEDRVLNAADYGDPTTRRRLFIMARRGNRPITWPEPTHSRTGGSTLFGQTERWRPARDVIDWSLPSRSIFGRKKPLSPKTMARIIAGLERFGGKDLQPFIVQLRGTSQVAVEASARSLDVPLSTVTASGAHHALCEPFVLVNNANNRPKGLDEPVPTVTGGNRHYLCEPFVLQQQSGGAARSVDSPLPTIATDGAQALVECGCWAPDAFHKVHGLRPGEHCVNWGKREGRAPGGEPFLVPFHGERRGQAERVNSIDEPLPTQTTENCFAVVEPFISSYYGTKNVSPVSAPLPTVTTKDRFALVLPMVDGRVLDVRLRMLQPHELARAMSFGDGYKFTGNKSEQVKQIGNAWPCRLGQALIETIIGEYAGAESQRSRMEATA
jgi:DNA (cytosine-5)-methyltransferase 1